MEKKTISNQPSIRTIIEHPNNKKTVDQIVLKMGRLLAKKKNLSDRPPQLVYEDRIWLGNYIFASDLVFLNSNNITTVISCLQLSPSILVDGITYKKIPLKDEKDLGFEEGAFQFCKEIENTKGNVFSGVSRSVALVISYIMKKEQIDYEKAAQRIRSVYPAGKPNSFFVESLIRLQSNLKEENTFKVLPGGSSKESNQQVKKQENTNENESIIKKDNQEIKLENNQQEERILIQQNIKEDNLIDMEERESVAQTKQLAEQVEPTLETNRQQDIDKKQGQLERADPQGDLKSHSNQNNKRQDQTEDNENSIPQNIFNNKISQKKEEESPEQEKTENIVENSSLSQTTVDKVEEIQQNQAKKSYLLLQEEKEKEEPKQLEPLDKEEEIVQEKNFQHKKKKNKKKKK